jgi:hypothetical protein
VVTFGTMAKDAWSTYTAENGSPAGVAVANLMHPTLPESAGGTKTEKAANTKKMLKQWSAGLAALFPVVAHRDVPTSELVPYGDAFTDADKADIPSFDLPAGVPPWMYDDDGWAARVGSTAAAKRRNIALTVPDGVIP